MTNKGPENIRSQKKIENPDNLILNLEQGNDNYTSVNIERTTDFCRENFNIPENKEKICTNLNNNFLAGLGNQGIDFQSMLEKYNLPVENLA